MEGRVEEGLGGGSGEEEDDEEGRKHIKRCINGENVSGSRNRVSSLSSQAKTQSKSSP